MKENRKWPRVYFSSKDAVAGELWVAENRILSARVLNISEGGLALTLLPEEGISLRKGDRFRIKSLNGPDMLVLTAPAVVEVVWVAASEGFSHVGLGCAFLYVVPPDKNRLRRFVESFG